MVGLLWQLCSFPTLVVMALLCTGFSWVPFSDNDQPSGWCSVIDLNGRQVSVVFSLATSYHFTVSSWLMCVSCTIMANYREQNARLAAFEITNAAHALTHRLRMEELVQGNAILAGVS